MKFKTMKDVKESRFPHHFQFKAQSFPHERSLFVFCTSNTMTEEMALLLNISEYGPTLLAIAFQSL